MLALIFYITSICSIAASIFLIEKGKEKLNGISWFVLTIITIIGYQGFIGGIVNLVNLPVGIITIGGANWLVSLIFFKIIFENKKIQKYYYDRIDIIFTIVAFLILLNLVYHRFGFGLDINFQSVDATVHMKLATDTVKNHSISTNLYLSSLNEALIIEVLKGIVPKFFYYKIFVLCEIFYLFLAGMIFYTIVRNYSKNIFLQLAACVTTIFYWLGYPLYSTVFGFSYFGLGITVIAYLIAVCDMYVDKLIKREICIIMLALGCYSLMVCYTLFVPVVFLGIFICILNGQIKKKMMISLETIWTMLSVFLIPCILGLIYSFRNVKELAITSSTTTAFANEGGSYRDLYSDFILILPLIIAGYWFIIKKIKKINMVITTMPLLIIFMIILFKLGMDGKVSSYYFCKNHSLLWLLSFICVFWCVETLSEKHKEIVIGFFVTYLILFGFDFKGGDNYILNKNSNFISVTSKNFINIYDFTKLWYDQPKFDGGKLELYKYASDAYQPDVNNNVLVFGNELEEGWFQTLTDQDSPKCNGDINTYNEIVSTGKAEYVCVLYGDAYQTNQAYFDSLEKVYQNGVGFIAKIK